MSDMRLDRMGAIKTTDMLLNVDDVTAPHLSLDERMAMEMRFRNKQHQETIQALGIVGESVVAAIRDQTRDLQQGMDSLVEANWRIADAIDRWGAETVWRLDTINDNLKSMDAALDQAVVALQRPNETASREKWEDAREAWLDKRYDRAKQLYEEALELYDALSPASFQLGNLLLTEFNDHQAALRAYQLTVDTATRRLPSLAALAYYNMHLVYSLKGEKRLSKDALLKAVTLKPSLLSALWDLALVSAELGDLEQLKKSLILAIDVDPIMWHRAAVYEWDHHHGFVSEILKTVRDDREAQFDAQLDRLQLVVERIRGMVESLPDEVSSSSRRPVTESGRDLLLMERKFDRSNLLNLIEGESFFPRARATYLERVHVNLKETVAKLKQRLLQVDQRHKDILSHEEPYGGIGVFFLLLGALSLVIGGVAWKFVENPVRIGFSIIFVISVIGLVTVLFAESKWRGAEERRYQQSVKSINNAVQAVDKIDRQVLSLEHL